MSFFVYLLVCTDGSTYVGATVDLDHRLRQHNKEIKGGAVQTSKKVLRGETWSRECYVSGFPSWKSALQFEWRWKQLTRKMFSGRFFNVERRKLALDALLALPKATSSAIPYSEWDTPPRICTSPLQRRPKSSKNIELSTESLADCQDISPLGAGGRGDAIPLKLAKHK